ncbi:unnamed protein product [Jaminaea pallidilutea]
MVWNRFEAFTGNPAVVGWSCVPFGVVVLLLLHRNVNVASCGEIAATTDDDEAATVILRLLLIQDTRIVAAASQTTFAIYSKATMLVPPNNFGMVEEDLYRSGAPDAINIPFLAKLQLKSVLWLAPEEPGPHLFALCQAHQIDLYHLGNPHHYQRQRSQGDSSGGAGTVVSSSSSVGVTSSAWEPITEELVLQALHLLVQPSTYPAIVMCNQGRHRTGTVIGTFRKLQRWALSSILEEYRRYAGSKIRLMNEQFIELFDIDLVFE